jgi:hypothetical protein
MMLTQPVTKMVRKRILITSTTGNNPAYKQYIN